MPDGREGIFAKCVTLRSACYSTKTQKLTSADLKKILLYIFRKNHKNATCFSQNKEKIFVEISLKNLCKNIELPKFVCYYLHINHLSVRLMYNERVVQKMDDKKNKNKNENESSLILTEYKKMTRRERYLYERDKGRLVLFDDRYTQDSRTKNTFVEDLIITRNMHKALDKALRDLTLDEYIIIEECFFDGGNLEEDKNHKKKVNYTKLAQKHGISRQAYTKKRDSILKKLKELVIYYYKEL